MGTEMRESDTGKTPYRKRDPKIMEHLTGAHAAPPGAHEHQGEPHGSRMSACGQCEIFLDLVISGAPDRADGQISHYLALSLSS